MKRGALVSIILFSLLGIFFLTIEILPVEILYHRVTGYAVSGGTCGNYSLAAPFRAVESSSFSQMYNGQKTIDSQESTYWLSNTTGPHWIYFDFGSTRCVNTIQVYINGSTGYSLLETTFDIQVSDDATTWVTLSRTEAVKTYNMYDTTSFAETKTRYLRLSNITSDSAGNGTASTSRVSIAEVRINSAPFTSDSGTGPAVCNDSDGGRTYNMKGTTIHTTMFGANTSVNDTCSSAKALTEYFCSDNQILSEPVECQLSCVDGACLSSLQPPAGGPCLDYDNGSNTAVASNVTLTYSDGTASPIFDMCHNITAVNETVCDANGNVSIITLACFDGQSCVNGACLDSSSEGEFDDFALLERSEWQQGTLVALNQGIAYALDFGEYFSFNVSSASTLRATVVFEYPFVILNFAPQESKSVDLDGDGRNDVMFQFQRYESANMTAVFFINSASYANNGSQALMNQGNSQLPTAGNSGNPEGIQPVLQTTVYNSSQRDLAAAQSPAFQRKKFLILFFLFTILFILIFVFLVIVSR